MASNPSRIPARDVARIMAATVGPDGAFIPPVVPPEPLRRPRQLVPNEFVVCI